MKSSKDRSSLRLLHTSDWHIGRALYGRKRYEENERFLDWLARFIESNRVDVLLVAGDIFDTTTPSNRAQELYYRFICRVADSTCRHVVITSGNHDSPSFLDAPRAVLRHLNVHVVGQASDNPEDEILALEDATGAVELVVCAVPYLRERDLRVSEAGESREEKDHKLLEGIRAHYRQVCDAAAQLRVRQDPPLPLVAMGHLFAAGAAVTEDDGVREIYVGSLTRIGADAFPPCIDYLALGHLHTPQCVGGRESFRYSGAPLPMNFTEARQAKALIQVDFVEGAPNISEVEVPCFQPLERITGDLDAIGARIEALKAGGSGIWLEIVYEGDEIPGDLRATLDDFIADTDFEILRVKNNRIVERALAGMGENETLNELDVYEVFQRCLDAHEVSPEQRPGLEDAYREMVIAIHESDTHAE